MSLNAKRKNASHSVLCIPAVSYLWRTSRCLLDHFTMRSSPATPPIPLPIHEPQLVIYTSHSRPPYLPTLHSGPLMMNNKEKKASDANRLSTNIARPNCITTTRHHPKIPISQPILYFVPIYPQYGKCCYKTNKICSDHRPEFQVVQPALYASDITAGISPTCTVLYIRSPLVTGVHVHVHLKETERRPISSGWVYDNICSSFRHKKCCLILRKLN
jgi:hypothetical protein